MDIAVILANRIAEMGRHVHEYSGAPTSTESPEYILADFLTGVRLYADQQGIEFHKALDRSYEMYLSDLPNLRTSTGTPT